MTQFWLGFDLLLVTWLGFESGWLGFDLLLSVHSEKILCLYFYFKRKTLVFILDFIIQFQNESWFLTL